VIQSKDIEGQTSNGSAGSKTKESCALPDRITFINAQIRMQIKLAIRVVRSFGGVDIYQLHSRPLR
jgi:hypothetical protein